MLWLELFLFILALLCILHIRIKRKLPPGPFSIPILGTLDIYTKKGGALNFAEEYFKYKEFCTFFMGPLVKLIMVNDYKLVKDIFNRDEFSGRPKQWFHQNIRGFDGRNLGIINTDGPIWTEQRRFALKHLRDMGFGKKSLDSLMVQEIDVVIDKLLEQKDGIITMKSTFNASILNCLWQIATSRRLEPGHPDTKKVIEIINSQFQTSLINFFVYPSFGKYLPLRKLDHSFIELKNMLKGIISEHKKDIDYDNPRDFIDVYLTEMRSNPNFDEQHLTVICLDFLQAGSDTTSTTLLFAVMFMILNPNVQEKCQAEVSDLIGSRSPSIEDAKDLPYVMATLLEIQRLAKVAPGSLPHILMKDTVVNDYHFPKNTMFIANITKFHMDPEVFPSPEIFQPERFIDENGKYKKNDQVVPFGIGKRVCMGDTLAKNEMFIFFVRMLQRITFHQTPNKTNPNNVIRGIVTVPKPFEVKVTPK